MLQFIITNVLMVSVGALLYLVIRTLPRIEPDPAGEKPKGFFEQLIVSKIPERVDGVFNSFAFKFLRRLKVILLKIDNVVGHQIKKVKPEASGGSEAGGKPAIDFTEITEKK